MLLKIYNKEIDDILRDIHDLREIIIYMISFERTIRDEQDLESDEE